VRIFIESTRRKEKTMKRVSLQLDMTEDELWAFAQFLKRSQWEHYRECAVDDDEAYVIRAAVLKLQDALREAGYSPR